MTGVRVENRERLREQTLRPTDCLSNRRTIAAGPTAPRSSPPPGSCPRVRLLVDLEQVTGVHVGVTLCGGKACVPEELLDRSQVRPPGQEVGGEAVAQRVGA